MNTLRPGSSGDEVMLLQSRLAELDFPPGKIDGDFGPGTEAAVRAFQYRRMLLADGIAGPSTLAALGPVSDPGARSGSRTSTPRAATSRRVAARS